MNTDLLHRMFDAFPAGVVLVGPEGSLLLANERVERLFGYGPGELAGQPAAIILNSDLGAQPASHGREWIGRRKDGSPIRIELGLVPRWDALEGVLLATVRAAPSRASAENPPMTGQVLFRALFDSAPDAVVAVDPSGQIAWVNPQVQRMFGYAPRELVGQRVDILVPACFAGDPPPLRGDEAARPAVLALLSGPSPSGRRKDGSEVPLDILLQPFLLPGSDLFLCVLRDDTKRRDVAQELAEKIAELEEKAAALARSNEDLEMFAYAASHDLQEPLRIVASSCLALEQHLGDTLDENTRDFLRFAVESAQRMRRLIRDLLAYSRATEGGESGLVPLDGVMREAWENLGALVEETGAILDAEPLPTVPGDASQLLHVFQNLIGNGIKFHGPRPPRITVRARRDERCWDISVQDNGIGIPERQHSNIFLIFHRLHARERYEGTGIGLSLCRKVIERGGGRIWVESEEGVGSIFHFTLAPASA